MLGTAWTCSIGGSIQLFHPNNSSGKIGEPGASLQATSAWSSQQRESGGWMQSIVEAVLAQGKQQPERTAISFEDQIISYAQLCTDIKRFALGLRNHGLRPRDRVGLYMGNSLEFVVAYFGTQLAGGVAVPINPQYRHTELSHILSDAQPSFCITDSQLVAEVSVPSVSATDAGTPRQ